MMDTLCANDSVSTSAISRYTTRVVVLAEQVPEQYQLTGVDMFVLHCSVADVPSNADVLCGLVISAASLYRDVNSWQTRRVSAMLPAIVWSRIPSD